MHLSQALLRTEDSKVLFVFHWTHASSPKVMHKTATVPKAGDDRELVPHVASAQSDKKEICQFSLQPRRRSESKDKAEGRPERRNKAGKQPILALKAWKEYRMSVSLLEAPRWLSLPGRSTWGLENPSQIFVMTGLLTHSQLTYHSVTYPSIVATGDGTYVFFSARPTSCVTTHVGMSCHAPELPLPYSAVFMRQRSLLQRKEHAAGQEHASIRGTIRYAFRGTPKIQNTVRYLPIHRIR